jgi:hypothetical protein
MEMHKSGTKPLTVQLLDESVYTDVQLCSLLASESEDSFS